MRRFISLACLVALTGCASSGPVPIGKDTYMITKESAGGMFVSGSAVKADVFKEAYAYCASQGKDFQVVNTHQEDAIPGARLPSAEVQFMCLNRDDPSVSRPNLRLEPNLVIEHRNR